MPGNGQTISLREDLWKGVVPKFTYPHLFFFTRDRKISLQKAASLPNLHSCFHLTLSEHIFQQYNDLLQQMEECNLSNEADTWSYIWGNGLYSSQKAYRLLKGTADIHPSYRWLWKSSCKLKHKIFFRLLLKGRLNTRDLLQRKNMHLQSYSCVLCPHNVLETSEHLFISCEMAESCWSILGISIDTNLDPLQLLNSF
jgi:hypothetical protein